MLDFSNVVGESIKDSAERLGHEAFADVDFNDIFQNNNVFEIAIRIVDYDKVHDEKDIKLSNIVKNAAEDIKQEINDIPDGEYYKAEYSNDLVALDDFVKILDNPDEIDNIEREDDYSNDSNYDQNDFDYSF